MTAKEEMEKDLFEKVCDECISLFADFVLYRSHFYVRGYCHEKNYN